MTRLKVIHDSMTSGLYIGAGRKHGILVNEDKTFFIGTVKIKKCKYEYFQYRDGKKVIQRYIGKVKAEYWL
ncbi:MAG: hypothetical protein V3R52_07455 [Candidatus Neomarinimicrobiota bacterium]